MPLPTWRIRFGLRGLLLGVLIIALISSNVVSLLRLRKAETELAEFRREFGYLGSHPADQLVAVRLPVEQPLQWRMRVRVPESARYRIAYSAMWPAAAGQPEWFGAVPIQPGESVVTIRIGADPRDGGWKMSALVRHPTGDRRMASTLVPALADVFRESHEVLRSGVGRQPIAVNHDQSLRLMEDRWLVGEGALRLYGASPPDANQPGVYVELQPDILPL